MGLWNYIQLSARDGHILVFTACGETGTVHTISASQHERPLEIESLLYSVLQSLLESLLESLVQSLLETAALQME